MAYPPPPPPNDRLNTTPQVDNHPSDHNVLADAITDINNELGDNPKGTFADVEARLDAMIPAGVMWDFGGTTPPAGWVLCDGATYDGTDPTYVALWNALQSADWGGIESAFNVPDMRSRVAVGQGVGDVSGGVGASVGGTGGQTEVVLHKHANTAQQAQHRHTVDVPSTTSSTNGDHSHTIANGVWLNRGTTGGSASILVSAGGDQTATIGPSAQGGHAHATNPASFNSGYFDPPITMTNVDAGSGIDNMNPYGVVLKIIKL